MNILNALSLEKVMSGASTGTTWLSNNNKKKLSAVSPVDGNTFASIVASTAANYEKILKTAQEGFQQWRLIPAPQRGEIVRQIGLRLRDFKRDLGTLISYETGKSLQEGMGEIQEAIDVCDFCVGQSRMLYGMTTMSERPYHRLYEQYHPLGPVAIITAFNFPAAVWSWNSMIAAICGDVSIWKPSSKAPVTAIALQKILGSVIAENNLPEGIFSLVIGDRDIVGDRILHDRRIPLVSFTGSVASGKNAAKTVASRLGRTILELGGNNAIIVSEHADLQLAVPAIVFGSVGTAGQRCTTSRRIIVHKTKYKDLQAALLKAYKSLKIGNPLVETNHMGPLIDKQAVSTYQKALKKVVKQEGKILFGGKILEGAGFESGCYVEPAIVAAKKSMQLVREETFAPLLYLLKYDGDIQAAIAINNEVDQGLSSAIFSTDQREIETFLSASGSDCGLANVNIGTSGAEIGGAFGGEKDTGGGRESGSDAWKSYMRRQTVTINYGTDTPLAQGIRFEIE